MELVSNKKDLIVRPSLSEGQKVLYELMHDRISTKKPVLADDAVEIWSTIVCRQQINGKPAWWNWYHHQDGEGQWQGGLSLMSDNEVKVRSIQWLLSAIGALVVKGYLKVIPTLELN